MLPPPRTDTIGEPLLTPDEELELLALLSPADIEEAKSDDNTGYLMALLLLAGLVGTRYIWRPERGAAGQFINTVTGRALTQLDLRRELDRYLDMYGRQMRQLAGQLRNGQISLAQWEIAMRRHIRNAHLNAIALERGGWSQMTLADFQRAGQLVRGEFGYLRDFAAEIANKKQRLDGTLDWRANLYAQAPRTSFYESHQANLRDGLTHVRSRRTARDSCRRCIELDGKWFRVGDPSYDLPGRRDCLRNCRCYEEYGRINESGEIVTGGMA